MNSKDWNDIKTSPEPTINREVLIMVRSGEVAKTVWLPDTRKRLDVTHWQYWEGPVVDPFMEWRNKASFDGMLYIERQRIVWDAGVKWAREHPEEKTWPNNPNL